MTIEHYSCYKYIIHRQVLPVQPGYTYEILLKDDYMGYPDSIESQEFFDTEQEARFAVIGHIDLLENGGS
jgi:hypothetical protein